jgi:hypothetical protein
MIFRTSAIVLAALALFGGGVFLRQLLKDEADGKNPHLIWQRAMDLSKTSGGLIEAEEMMSRAAEADPAYMSLLAAIYREGNPLPKDTAKAQRLDLEAAKRGSIKSLERLATASRKESTDLSQLYKWTELLVARVFQENMPYEVGRWATQMGELHQVFGRSHKSEAYAWYNFACSYPFSGDGLKYNSNPLAGNVAPPFTAFIGRHSPHELRAELEKEMTKEEISRAQARSRAILAELTKKAQEAKEGPKQPPSR